MTAVATGLSTADDAVTAARAACGQVASGLDGAQADLAVIFVGAAYADHLAEIDEVVASLGPRHRIGTSTAGVIADGSEVEQHRCVAVWAAGFDGVDVTPLRFSPPTEDLRVTWPQPPADAKGVVLLADPVTFAPVSFFSWLEDVRPGLPVSGGLASASHGGNRLLLDGAVYADGAVGVALSGAVRLRTLVSQGCRPVGRSYTVTRAEGNLLQELGGAQPITRVREAFTEADPADRALIRTGLHIGTVIDEYKETFGRGDFLVRGVLGAEPGSGAIAIGDLVGIGQTVQFHVRDAGSADEDLRELLRRAVEDAADDDEAKAVAGLLFTCNGRGRRLFGQPDHDATLVREILGDIPLAGFFCAGEFGPVGARNFIHGYTASLLVFEERAIRD